MKCYIDGCEGAGNWRGLCNTHRLRLKKHGDPTVIKNRRAGLGTLRADGYIMHESGGRAVLEHVMLAERALGKPLPRGVHVHHVDENRSNNAPSNLVICTAAYHRLLHLRMRAFAACGHYDWLRCGICGQWSPPSEIKVYVPSGNRRHPTCKAGKNGIQLSPGDQN